jgi:hypothetical protein
VRARAASVRTYGARLAASTHAGVTESHALETVRQSDRYCLSNNKQALLLLVVHSDSVFSWRRSMYPAGAVVLLLLLLLLIDTRAQSILEFFRWGLLKS